MAEFLTTKDTLSRIDRVIRRADSSLTIITPYVQISADFARRLGDADERGVKTRLVCRTKKLKPEQWEILSGFENLTVHDDPKLHAKCFVNEQGLVLTSLNFYEASEQNNEMGVYLDAKEDRRAYREAVTEAESIVRAATPATKSQKRSGKRNGSTTAGRTATTVPKQSRWSRFKKPAGSKSDSVPAGHCIRCGAEIDYDPKRPYCLKHYKEWAKWSDPTYGDDRCHGCGKRDAKAFSLEKPECYTCYKASTVDSK